MLHHINEFVSVIEEQQAVDLIPACRALEADIMCGYYL